MIETTLKVSIHNRGDQFYVEGDAKNIAATLDAIQQLYAVTEHTKHLQKETVQLILRSVESHRDTPIIKHAKGSEPIKTTYKTVKARTPTQHEYLNAIQAHDVNFGIGPAGTGKSYLAVACAIDALFSDTVSKIILVRPAVEAGEKLGFLPGDLSQKVDPYLRPLYDALVEMLGGERVGQLTEKGIIEIAPLAYMRGRTLNDAFIILDESQNTTREQMKMFLTRIGFGSKAVITGDATQVDLPRSSASGLKHAMQLLKNVNDISFTYFKSSDVVRHPLVQKIVEAYEKEDRG
jgi:phosphate starvation-inducible PhoH-like protein